MWSINPYPWLKRREYPPLYCLVRQMKASSTNKCSLNECEEFRWWLERMRMVGIDFESIHYVCLCPLWGSCWRGIWRRYPLKDFSANSKIFRPHLRLLVTYVRNFVIDTYVDLCNHGGVRHIDDHYLFAWYHMSRIEGRILQFVHVGVPLSQLARHVGRSYHNCSCYYSRLWPANTRLLVQ